MDQFEKQSEQSETEIKDSTSEIAEEQVDLKVKRVKALKTGLKGGTRISGAGRGFEEA